MQLNKTEILHRICYTELVYQRINKKLMLSLSKNEIEKLLYNSICDAPIENFQKFGKNIYITNNESKIRITINSNTYRIITVNKIAKPLTK